MKESDKNDLFEDAMAEFKQSLKLVRNKFTVIDQKVEDLGQLTDDFHYSTDKLESLFMRDIDKRRKYFLEHPMSATATTEDGSEVDLAEIDAVFDQIEKDEKRSLFSILLYLHNIGMIGVIAFAGYVYNQMSGLGGAKTRFD